MNNIPELFNIRISSGFDEREFRRVYRKGIYLVRKVVGKLLHYFNNLLLAKFCHPPVNKKLRDYANDRRNYADYGGIKYIF